MIIFLKINKDSQNWEKATLLFIKKKKKINENGKQGRGDITTQLNFSSGKVLEQMV